MREKFQEQSISKLLIDIIYLTGELPYDALRILGVSANSTMKVARALVKEHYLKIEKANGARTLLLDKNRSDYEAILFPHAKEIQREAVKNTYYNPRNAHTHLAKQASKTNRSRNLKLARLTAFFVQSKVGVFPEDKPMLGETPITETTKGFYLSADIKRKMESEESKKLGSRNLGCLAYNNRLYMTYFLDKTVIKVSKDTERKSKIRMEALFAQNTETVAPLHLKDAIVITQKYELLVRVLGSYKGNDRKEEKKLFSIDNTFNQYYFFPYSKEGIQVFHMVFGPGGKEKLLRIVLSAEEIPTTPVNVDCDGVRADGTYVLVLFDCECKQLQRFLDIAEIQRESGRPDKFQIICFDFQVTSLRAIVSKNVTVYSYSVEQVAQNYAQA